MPHYALIGPTGYGSFRFVGRPLAERLGCEVYDSRSPFQLTSAHYRAICTLKADVSSEVRRRCELLVYHPVDHWTSCGRASAMQPADYWRQQFDRNQFDVIVASTVAAAESMRAALPGSVRVEFVPHPANPGVHPGGFDASGPVVYSGLRTFIAGGLAEITAACLAIGRPFVHSSSSNPSTILRGAALVLAPRLPPSDNPLNRVAKPTQKVENAIAAGLPLLATDCPAITLGYPDACVAKAADWLDPAILAGRMRAAIDRGPLLRAPFTLCQHLDEMCRLMA